MTTTKFAQLMKHDLFSGASVKTDMPKLFNTPETKLNLPQLTKLDTAGELARKAVSSRPPEAAALGKYRNRVYGLTKKQLEHSAAGRVVTHKIRALHRVFNPDSRWASCGTPGVKPRIAVKRSANGKVSLSGVETCGSAAACFACGNKIRARRCNEIQDGVSRHIAAGGTAMFVSVTLPHSFNDGLANLWDILTKSWSRFISGGSVTGFRKKYGQIGAIKAVEATHGGNGWHPHVHAIFLFDRHIEAYSDEWIEIVKWIHLRWKDQVEHEGLHVSLQHGIDVRPCRDSKGLGEYVSKIGAEMALTSSKQGREGSRTPWQIARDFLEYGDKKDLALWLDWCKTSKGKVLLYWGKGLKKRLLIEDLTDKEIVKQEVEGEVEGHMTSGLYQKLLTKGVACQTLNVWQLDSAQVAACFIKSFVPETVAEWDSTGALCLRLDTDLPLSEFEKEEEK